VRIVAATNRQLRDVPWFRSDLYFRIACVTVTLPRLAERREDIPLLAHALLERISRSASQPLSVDDSALQMLQSWDFPGNIRELRNVLWVAVVNARGNRITAGDIAAALPDSLNGSPRIVPALDSKDVPPLPTSPPPASAPEPRLRPRPKWQRDHLTTVLQRHMGNRRRAAEELGVSERTIYRKLREFGLA
jgi:DNA-binding NtrC family response regulator